MRIILWDIMDTLVRDPFFTHMPAYFGRSFQSLVGALRPKVWVEFELGQLEEPDFYAQFWKDGSAMDAPMDGPGLKRCMHQAYAFIDGIEPLLAELKQRGVEMHALSNYPPWYRLIDERLGLSRYVELSFVSCNTGVRKPDPEAYAGACRALACAPSDCLFIDDRASNCDAARATGMAALQFQGDVPGLRLQLGAAGFLGTKAL